MKMPTSLFTFVLVLFSSSLHIEAGELKTFYAPHFTNLDGLWTTELSLSHSDGVPHLVHLSFFDNAGAPSGEFEVELRPYAGIQGPIQDLFPDLQIETGSIRIQTESESFAGTVVFTFNQTQATDSLPIERVSYQNFTLPRLETHATKQSGFVLSNPGANASGYRLTLRSYEGITIQSLYGVLDPQAKFIGMLESLFEGPIPEQTYLEVEAENPLNGFGLTFWDQHTQIEDIPASITEQPQLSEEDQLINEAFRVDIQTIDADLDFYPANGHMNGSATVTFTMLPGQTRPLFHLDYTIADRGFSSIKLNGEVLDPDSDEDLQVIPVTGTSMRGLHIQRDLVPYRTHTLELQYSKLIPTNVKVFYTDVNDIQGNGNETFFPTINRPAELARHRLRLTVTDTDSYHCIGSGLVETIPDSSSRSFLLDTERQVASYTVMFFIGSQSQVGLRNLMINDTPVHIMTELGHEQLANQAEETLITWLPQLEDHFGAFPMRALSLFMTPSGGGMEYFGGTVTSNWALRHEVVHMYFACSTIAKTYRDSWWDEAITSWYEEWPTNPAINDAYQSDMVSGRSPIDIGFDTDAYNQGAQMFEHISQSLGSYDALVHFLGSVAQTYQWSPISTKDLVYLLLLRTGLDYEAKFDQWLFNITDESKMQPTHTPHIHRVQLPTSLLEPQPPGNRKTRP